MSDDASVSGNANTREENVTLREHLDNPLVVLFLIAIFVYAIGGVGRYFGHRTNKPGISSFFGG